MRPAYRLLGLPFALLLVACGGAASPPASTAPAGGKPAAQASGGTVGGSWDDMVAKAKQEGEVDVWASNLDVRGNVNDAFERAFPGIKVSLYATSDPAERDTRFLAEREANVAKADLLVGNASSVNGRLKPVGAVTPLKPFLVLPEVTDMSKWFGGDYGWADKEGQFILVSEATPLPVAAVNKAVAENDLVNWQDLLNPKYKGKIVMPDPRGTGRGGGLSFAMYFNQHLGPDFFTKVMQQNITFSQDTRRNIEMTADGRMLINLAPAPVDIRDLQKVGGEIRPIKTLLAPDGTKVTTISSGSTSISVPSTALPHPNAARVFLNWWLSKDGQQVLQQTFNGNSRRLDVDKSKVDPLLVAESDVDYTDTNKYSDAEFIGKMRDAVTAAVGK